MGAKISQFTCALDPLLAEYKQRSFWLGLERLRQTFPLGQTVLQLPAMTG